MTVLEFVQKKGWEYKIQGKEVHLKECPYCHDTNWRFNINLETGAYICNRQSSCRARGVFNLDNNAVDKKPRKVVKLDKNQFDSVRGSKTMLDYMKSRGISLETLLEARVLKTAKNNVFCFFYTDASGKPTGIKFRTLDKKIWAQEGSEMTLLNWDRVKDTKILYLVEGEVDMLSAMEVGYKNVVSVPNGVSNMDWIQKHWEWLGNFETIVLCYDNDNAGKQAIKECVTRLSDLKCKDKSGSEKYVELKGIDLLFYKDLNEVLCDEEGANKLKNILSHTTELKTDNVIYAEEVNCENDTETIDWGDRAFNLLTGGCRTGEVVLFTGNSGCGKSTFVNNLMANLLNQGYSVYTHQGEFRPGKFKSNLYKILCTSDKIETYKNEFKNRIYGTISKKTEEKIDAWVKGRLIIHGSQVPTKDELIRTMTNMYKKHGIKFFFVDNLMTIAIDGTDKYEEQKQLMIKFQEFAKTYNVFVGIVAHPKKNNCSLDEVDQYVISGASELINLANYAIYLKRLTTKEKEKIQEEVGIDVSTGGVSLKDREFGDIGQIEYWSYDVKTGRFLDILDEDKSKNKKYKWEKKEEVVLDISDLPW